MIGTGIILKPNGDEIFIKDDETLESLIKTKITKEMGAYLRRAELGGKVNESMVVQKAIDLGYLSHTLNTNDGSATFTSKGKIIKELITQWSKSIAKNKLQALEVETPDIYKANKVILSMQDQFGEPPFYINEEEILRPASDFGVFSLYGGKILQESIIPHRIFELANCFRQEDVNRVDLLARPRKFSMPDLHTFIQLKDLDNELKIQEDVYLDAMRSIELEFLVSVRTTTEEYTQLKKHFFYLAQQTNKEVYINIVPSRKRYWTTKIKFIYVDSLGNNLQLTTIQTDHDSAKLFNIKLKDTYPSVLHSSLGSIERLMYALIDEGLKGKHFMLPLWISPVQAMIFGDKKNLMIGRLVRYEKCSETSIKSNMFESFFKIGIPYVIDVDNNIAYSRDDQEQADMVINKIEIINKNFLNLPKSNKF